MRDRLRRLLACANGRARRGIRLHWFAATPCRPCCFNNLGGAGCCRDDFHRQTTIQSGNGQRIAMGSQIAATPAALAKRLHSQLAGWFGQTYAAFTHAQLLAVPSIVERQSILLTAPTGSGKTLAAFLGIFDALLRKLDAGRLTGAVQCIYVSPLRALAYDIGKNVRAPIVGMALEKKLRIALRTGDTPSSERIKFREHGAHILITTPESLAVMLAQENYARHLDGCEFVVVDELHSFAGNKRGADLTLSLERLERLWSRRPVGDAGGNVAAPGSRC